MFCAFIRIIVLTSIPVFCLVPDYLWPPPPPNPPCMPPPNRPPETAVHTSPEAGLAAEGVLVCHAAVVESAECAGVAALLHVRRSEATVGSMVEVILVASEIVAVEIAAVGESVAVVEKSMASGNKPRVIKNHKATAPVAAPCGPSPTPTKTPADGKPYSERDDRRAQSRVLRCNPDKLLAVRRTRSKDHTEEHRRLVDSQAQ